MTRQTSIDYYVDRVKKGKNATARIEIMRAMYDLSFRFAPLTVGEICHYGGLKQWPNNARSRMTELRDVFGVVRECPKRSCTVTLDKQGKPNPPILTWQLVPEHEWVQPSKKKRPTKKQKIEALTEWNSHIMRHQIKITDNLRLYLENEWSKVM